ncbi:hypothetical protein ACW95P_04385 [Candidatus Mycoplasma pogonae]
MKGEQFEESIKSALKKFKFTEISSKNKEEEISILIDKDKKYVTNKLNNLKNNILSKEQNLEFITNPFDEINQNFIFQFNGSQNFPDILIFCDKYIFPLEIKYTKDKNGKNTKSMPKWNSNLPKNNSIYIYGKNGENLTFFQGDDFVSDEARGILVNFFHELTEKEMELLQKTKNDILNLKRKMDSNPFGLKPYIRKDYNYDLKFSTKENNNNLSIFEIANEKQWEKNVLETIENLKRKAME